MIYDVPPRRPVNAYFLHICKYAKARNKECSAKRTGGAE